MRKIIKHKKTIAIGFLGIVGSILLIVGPFLPWFVFLGGLQTFTGTAGLNGKIFLASGIITLVMSSGYLIKTYSILHWILGFIGFFQLVFSSYLLFKLYTTFHTLSSDGMSSMMDAGIGPGLFVTALGSFLVFSMLFIPMKKRNVSIHWNMKRLFFRVNKA